MDLSCDACGAGVLEIDVRCPSCGRFLASTGAHRMLGRVVLDQYEITDILGQGGMSVVYKARHQMTDQEVALKILPPELAAHAHVKSRFLEEARALAQLDHPNIVHLYNFGQENGCLVLAMQYIHGRTLERMIIDAEMLDWALTARVAVDVLNALEYAHSRGVIHRDMKPSNILVREDDGSATVMDFGIAKMTNSTRLTATGQTMGTVRYMSPEQVRGQKVDARTDLYSLGATIYEAVCGDTPFDGETHFEIMSKHLHEKPRPPSLDAIEVPAAFEEVLMRALAKRSVDRFRDAAEFRRALEAVLEQADAEPLSVGGMSRQGLAGRRNRERSMAVTAKETPREEPLANPLAGANPDVEPTSPLPRAATPRAEEMSRSSREPVDRAPSAAVGAESSAGVRERAPVGTARVGLWIAVTGVAVAAAAVGAMLVIRGGVAAKPAESNPPPTRDARPAPVRWPAAFRPPDMRFEVEREYPDEELRILAPRDVDPEQIQALTSEAHELFAAFLASREEAAEAAAVPRQPLSIVVVPQRAFCDRRLYDSPPEDLSDDCNFEYVYFRPYEKTLFVLDQPDQLRLAILDGVAISVCTYAATCVDLDELHGWVAERDERK